MAVRKDGGDPRMSLPEEPAEDIRPVVSLPRKGLPVWALIAFVVILGTLLFSILDARRRSAAVPDIRTAETMAIPPAPPPLMIPPAPQPPVAFAVPAPLPPAAPAPPIQGVAPATQPQATYVPQPVSLSQPAEPVAPPRMSAEPALVLDTGAPRAAPGAPAGGETGAAVATGPVGNAVAGPRARAGAMANRSATVPQGTLIPAVLETALDSTKPGLARAIVSRDVRGFDGRQILIPRGSRLIGEYSSDAQSGQRRALVSWFRLVRPDGVTIAVGSPSADPLGRGGIRARVNSHFFERFAGAILQSALDIGVNLAARQVGNDSVILLPGAVQGGSAGQAVQPQQVTPTLSVRQGTSISIFVARDLDFTGAETRR